MSAIPLLIYAPIIAVIFYAILGFLFGGYAERKTYCMVIATHQVMGLRYSSIYEIILISIGVSALGTGLLVAVGAVPVVDAYAFLPGAGWFTLLGSFIFGFGMMLGQGCMVGMLWKSGSGYVVNWMELLGLALGSIIFAFPIFNWLDLAYWWKNTRTANVGNGSSINYVPNILFGVPAVVGAAIIGIAFFVALLAVALVLRKRRLKGQGISGNKGKMAFMNSPYFVGTIFSFAMIASFVFAAGHSFNYLGVTTPVALFSQYLLSPFGVYLGGSSLSGNWYQTIPVISAFSFFILMIIAGATIFSMARGTFKIRFPSGSASKIGDLSIGFVGGIIIAIGARIAQGCSVGGFWSGLAGLSLFGLVFTVGIILGSVAGYFAYIFLSTKLAGLKTRAHSPAKVISRYRSLLEQYAFSIIFGLILVAIGLESLSANSKYIVKVPAGLMTQESYVMIIAGLIVMILGVSISTYHYIRTGEIKKPTTAPATR
ncbi:MAG: YeeE/YedE thiosulfate transporter family protein [Thermoplasmataceae archaeon]